MAERLHLSRYIRFVRMKTGSASLPQRRRARVLAWMQITLVITLAITLVIILAADLHNTSRMDFYLSLVAGLLVVVFSALILNFGGRYLWSASITVFCAFFGPWMSILFDPLVLKTDFVPLVYLALSILLCSFFLKVSYTIALALIQSIGLLFLIRLNPMLRSINWPSLYAFIFLISVVGIVASVVSEYDLKQINEQTTLLQQTGEELRRDIAERKRMEEERVKTIADLQQAIGEIKTLSGLIPICASCKKIRNDDGYYESVEHYIKEHSTADFTHSICDECMIKLYPGIS